MNEIIKNDIQGIIKEVIRILEVKEETDIIELKNLSNKTNHVSSIFQDEDSISIAILIYALSKTIERKFDAVEFNTVCLILSSAYDSLKNDDIHKYRKGIKSLFRLIARIDSKLKLYIGEIIKQAQIKRGGQIYKHGISLERTAEILGISQWELMNYIGHTKMSEFPLEGVNVRSRLDFTRRLFK